MTDASDRLSLPFIVAGQAQKEISHNEALMLLDMLVQPVVEAVNVSTPPATPQVGQSWIIGAAPTGGWAGKAKQLTIWTSDGWRFAVARAGMTCWSLADGLTARFSGSDWIKGEVTAELIRIGGETVVSARQPAIVNPAGGTVIDAEARFAITALLGTLRTHGLIFS